MFRTPFSPTIPEGFVPEVASYKHPGKAWELVYAAGGNYYDPTTDTYSYQEFSDTDFPKVEQAVANASLNKEAAYHGKDIEDFMEIAELLPKDLAGKFIEANNFAEDLGLEPFYYTHRLGILVPANGTDKLGRPPFGVVVGFAELPALDRNHRVESPRTSVRKFESIMNFALSPNVVMASMEQKTIWEGFAIEPVFSHNGPTIEKLNQNFEDLELEDTETDEEGGDPIVIG